MHVFTVRFGLLCLLALTMTACGKPPAPSPTSAPALKPTLPTEPAVLALPRDPTAQTIYREITSKLDTIQSYTCLWEGRESSAIDQGPRKGEVVELIHTEDRAFKRPEFLRVKHTQVKHGGLPFREGLVFESIVDGESVWHYNHASSEQVVNTALSHVSTPNMEARVRNAHSAAVTRTRIAPLREAGVWDSPKWPQLESILHPFAFCDLESLTLENETDEQWHLSAKPRKDLSEYIETVTLVIGKADGVLREVRSGKSTRQNVQRVSQVVLNPALADDVFRFEPPTDVTVSDVTDRDFEPL